MCFSGKCPFEYYSGDCQLHDMKNIQIEKKALASCVISDYQQSRHEYNLDIDVKTQLKYSKIINENSKFLKKFFKESSSEIIHKNNLKDATYTLLNLIMLENEAKLNEQI